MSSRFESDVQELKYKVLKEVAKAAFNDDLIEAYNVIPKKVIPGPKPSLRCCIYKERAIVQERIKLALGGDKNNDNIIEVINIACDECPLDGYEVTDKCRGCIAHKCQKVCPKGAISFDPFTRRSVIDKSKCINCGQCARACPYFAITNYQRPCQQACKVKAISAQEDGSAKINNDLCIQCGVCINQCPFGAIMDKSSIVDVIDALKSPTKVYGVVAPSIASQFDDVKLGQIFAAIKKLGFYDIVEAALGADMVGASEANELIQKGLLLSSCCPTFVTFIKKNYPELIQYISHNTSPMATVSKYIKENDPDCKICFIGPCISKKQEIKQENVKDYVDYVLTFEELAALIDSKDIVMSFLEETSVDNASFFGRIFGRSGGLKETIAQGIKESGCPFDYKPGVVDGLDDCKVALSKLKNKMHDFNFLEGMACAGGCIGGPGCLNHEIKDKSQIDLFAKESSKTSVADSLQQASKIFNK